MKKIIIGFIALVTLLAPTWASFASAADFFGTGFGTGLGADGNYFGNPYGDVSLDTGVHNHDHNDPFALCNENECLGDPCAYDCGCDYGCDEPACGYDCYEPCLGYGCEPEPTPAPVENTNVNNNTNINENVIVINNYIRSNRDNDNDEREASRAPVFVSTANTAAVEGQRYTYFAQATDANGDRLTYSLMVNPDGMSINSATGLIEWTPSSRQGGLAYQVGVSVTDGQREATQIYQIYVRDVARTGGPLLVTPPVAAEPVDRDTLFAYNVRVDVDTDGNSIVTWDTTEPSRGQVLYGRASRADVAGAQFTGPDQYEFATDQVNAMATSHRFVLGQLEAERVYYFRVVSSAGVQTDVSTERSFVQLPEGGTLNGEAGFASVIGTLGAFLISPWFLLLVIILIALALYFRRRSAGEVVAHAPIEVQVGGHH